MMPFSVIRTWGLGFISWALLGAGIYCLWVWNDRAHPRVVDRVGVNIDGARERDREIVLADDEAWPYLAAGIALTAWSFLGFLPVLPFLGKPKFDEPKAAREGRQLFVDRPDGSRLNVEIYGEDHATTLVMTHGWSLDSTEWYYAKRELAPRYRLVLWDLPGLGKSRGPDDHNYRLEKMAADLDAVVDAVSPHDPVFLVGHSIGGMITQTYCSLFADQLRTRVLGIVLVHTTYTNPLRTALGAPLWKALEKPLLVPLNYLTIALAPLAWLSNWQSYLNGSLQITSRITSFAGGQTWGQVDYASRLCAKASPAVVARGNLAMLEFDADETLPHISVPALVIGARHDRLTKVSASEHIDNRIGESVLTTVEAGHLGLWERHEDVCEAIDQFAQKYQTTAQKRAPLLRVTG